MKDMYDIVLDLVEHPEKYSDSEIGKILSDPESREIYNLLCKTKSSFESENDSIDVDREWENFSRRNRVNRYKLLPISNRAASILAIIFTSLAAVAIGVVFAVRQFEFKTPDEVEAQTTITTKTGLTPTDTLSATPHPNLSSPTEPILFEDERLETILDSVSKHYAVNVSFRRQATAKLRLYYKFNPGLPLEKIVEQLNNFEQINITVNDGTLTVD